MAELTAAEEILLAAAELSGEAREEFTEWDLTVRAWVLNRNRFGCRGYEEQYPDHKRVMMELMTRHKPVMQHGWLEKTRANRYRVTPLGMAEAARLMGTERTTHRRQAPLYDALEPFAFHKVFEAHKADPAEPRTWLGAAAFLALSGDDPAVLDRRMGDLESAMREAQRWMQETRRSELRRGDSGRRITKESIAELQGFVDALQERFAQQFDAIRRRRRE